MFIEVSQVAVLAMSDALAIGGIAVAIVAALVASLVFFHYGSLWFQAYMSGADVSVMSLIGMSLDARSLPTVVIENREPATGVL